MHKAKKVLWEERILALEASGLSRRAWSKEQGIPEHQVNYWVHKLRPESAATGKRWVALLSPSCSDTGISIQIGDVTVAIERGFDHRVLVEVIQALTVLC